MTENIHSDMKLRIVGNALVVGIPKKLAEAMGWNPGDEVSIEVAGKDRLTLRH